MGSAPGEFSKVVHRTIWPYYLHAPCSLGPTPTGVVCPRGTYGDKAKPPGCVQRRRLCCLSERAYPFFDVDQCADCDPVVGITVPLPEEGLSSFRWPLHWTTANENKYLSRNNDSIVRCCRENCTWQ
jgi:hypothetical protein